MLRQKGGDVLSRNPRMGGRLAGFHDEAGKAQLTSPDDTTPQEASPPTSTATHSLTSPWSSGLRLGNTPCHTAQFTPR